LGQQHIEVLIDQPTGSVTLIPEKDWNGYETLIFYASDQKSGEVSDSVNITIIPINDPPGIVEIKSPINDLELKEGQANYFEAECVDPDINYGDILTYTWTSNISGVLGKGETLEDIVLPPGVHLITVNVTDKIGEFSTADVQITIIELLSQDEDDDNLPDDWELHWFKDITKYNGTDDPDSDGKTNNQEYLNDTDPTTSDLDEKPEEAGDKYDVGILIAFVIVPIVFLVILLVFFIFLKKKKGGGDQPETQQEETKSISISTETTSPQTPHQQQKTSNYEDEYSRLYGERPGRK
jgi:hypothetical protein